MLPVVPLLSREYEHGTDRLVWTQSVPRFRWLAVKFTVLGAASGTVLRRMLPARQVITRWR